MRTINEMFKFCKQVISFLLEVVSCVEVMLHTETYRDIGTILSKLIKLNRINQ